MLEESSPRPHKCLVSSGNALLAGSQGTPLLGGSIWRTHVPVGSSDRGVGFRARPWPRSLGANPFPCLRRIDQTTVCVFLGSSRSKFLEPGCLGRPKDQRTILGLPPCTCKVASSELHSETVYSLAQRTGKSKPARLSRYLQREAPGFCRKMARQSTTRNGFPLDSTGGHSL